MGIDVKIGASSYLFSGLNDIKPDMLRQATEIRRGAVDEFAKNVGVIVGGIHTARQGWFQEEDTSGSGGHIKRFQKLVHVVTTITLYLDKSNSK